MTRSDNTRTSPDTTDTFNDHLEALFTAAQRNGVDVCGGYEIRLDGRGDVRFDVHVTAVDR